MDTIRNKVRYNKSKKSIIFNGKKIVDFSEVPENASGKVFSGVADDFIGTDIRLVIEDSDFPFNIQLACFSAAGFVMAIVKNRLEVGGMVTSKEIRSAYDFISKSMRFQI